MPGANQNYGGILSFMNQYNSQSRASRQRKSSSRRHNSEPSQLRTVLLFYVLPFIVVNTIIFFLVTSIPKGTVTVGETADFQSTVVELHVDSLLPIKAPAATLDSNPIELTKTGSRTYTATLTSNGNLTVELEGYNRMKSTIYQVVSVLDDTPPAIQDTKMDDEIISLRFTDSQSGVDFSTVLAYDENEKEILPLTIDRSTGEVTFQLPKTNLTICARDLAGNEVRGTFSPEGEAITEENSENGSSEELSQEKSSENQEE